MTSPAQRSVHAVAAMFTAAADTQHQLLHQARELGAACGVEVLALRAGEEPGVWVVRLRVAAKAVAPVPAGDPRLEAPPPFLTGFRSPVRHAEPFTGNGTADLLSLIAASDPLGRVPPRGATATGSPPQPLGEDERLRMLAGTIAGDALLSLQHQGLDGDAAAVEAALRKARLHYARELERAGAAPADFDEERHFTRAADTVRRQLLGVG